MAIQPSPQRSPQTSAQARTRPARELTRSTNGAQGDEALARGLGWFSIGLGLAELIVPRRIARLSGVPPRRGLLRAYGMRELTSGVGILAEKRPTMWLWSRVAGDVLDLASLAGALASRRSRRGRVLAATAAVAGVTALDVLCARRLSQVDGRSTSDTGDGVRVRASITVNRPPADVYRFWRDFPNLAKVMRHVDSVQVRGERRSHWVAIGPGGVRLEWESEVVEDHRDERIAWKSLPGGDVETEGSVRFVPAPGGRGTEVHVDMTYRAPGGVLASTLGRFFGGTASTFASEDLRPLKQLLETGEIPTNAVHGGRKA
jgi:uncharacterized membrane protein